MFASSYLLVCGPGRHPMRARIQRTTMAQLIASAVGGPNIQDPAVWFPFVTAQLFGVYPVETTKTPKDS